MHQYLKEEISFVPNKIHVFFKNVKVKLILVIRDIYDYKTAKLTTNWYGVLKKETTRGVLSILSHDIFFLSNFIWRDSKT